MRSLVTIEKLYHLVVMIFVTHIRLSSLYTRCLAVRELIYSSKGAWSINSGYMLSICRSFNSVFDGTYLWRVCQLVSSARIIAGVVLRRARISRPRKTRAHTPLPSAPIVTVIDGADDKFSRQLIQCCYNHSRIVKWMYFTCRKLV